MYSRSRLPRLVVEQHQGEKDESKSTKNEDRIISEDEIERMITAGKGRKRGGDYSDKVEEGGRKRKKRRKIEILPADWGETDEVSGGENWLRSGMEW